MTQHRIRELLLRYEAAETSLDEERELRTYFTGSSVDPEFAHYSAVFVAQQVLAKAASPQYKPGPWDLGPSSAVKSSAAVEQNTPSTSDLIAKSRSQASPLRVVHKQRQPVWIALAVAASLALLIALLLPALQRESVPQPIANNIETSPASIDWSKYEVTDPHTAARITKAALSSVATRMKSGSELTTREIGRMRPIRNAL